MNTEVTGLTLTEWLFMVGLTVFLGGWAYFNHSVLVLGPYGRVDPILLAAMLWPGVFLFMKHGETYLRARSQQVATGLGLFGIMKFTPQIGGGGIEAVPYNLDKEGWVTALPALLPIRLGVSKPTLPILSAKPRYLFAPGKYLKKFGGVVICQADVSRFDGDRHNDLISNIRDKLTVLPGVVLDQDTIIFGDNLGGSWPRKMKMPGFDKEIHVIPSTSNQVYNIQEEHARNREHAEIQTILKKTSWSVDKLRGKDFFGGL